MPDIFNYIDYDVQDIQGKKFICIYVLDFEKRIIFKIFKPYNDKLKEFLEDLNLFECLNTNLTFVIKRDGKITLDIKI